MKRSVIFPLLLIMTIIQSNSFSQTAPFLKRSHSNKSLSAALMPYRLCIPVGYDASRAYPLVLFLHGAGERGTDNNSQLTANRGATLWAELTTQQKYPCFVLAPQCGVDKQWVNTPWGKGSYGQDTIPMSEQLSMVLDILDSLEKEFPVNLSKVYVTGISMGGYGTWDLITRFPSRFAAAIPVCGAGDPSKSSLLGNLPLRVFASSDDPVVPVSGSRNMVNAIIALGQNNRTRFYTEYTNQGHSSWVNAYNTPDLVSWLFDSKPVKYRAKDIKKSINQH